MRTLVIALLVLAALAGVVQGATQTKVSATLTGDLSSLSVINGTLAQGHSFIHTYYLPMELDELTNSTTILVVAANSSFGCNVTVVINGVTVASNYRISAATSKSWSASDWSTAGVPMNRTTLAINVTAVVNSTQEIRLGIYANDGQLSGSNVTISVTETKVTTPEVGYKSSFYTVKDTVTVSQTSDFNLTDVKATFTYPNHASSKDVKTYTFGSLNTSQSKKKVLAYQKRGPFVSDIDTDTGTTNTVTMKIYSYEDLKATFEFNALEDPWSDYFPDLDKDTLKIELNSKDVSFDDPAGDIKISRLNLEAGTNKLVFTYTPATENVSVFYVVAVQEVPWWQETVYGIPYFWTLVIAAIAILAIGLAASTTSKR